MMRALLLVSSTVAALGGVACSRSGAPSTGATATPSASASTTVAVASPAAAAGKPFGAFCVEDEECAARVCFHKRLKGANAAPERRDASDAVEHDGYCSMHCSSDADCPSPPSSGRCGARGMCKRPD